MNSGSRKAATEQVMQCEDKLHQNVKFLFAFPVYNAPHRHYRLHTHWFHELILVNNGRFRSRAAGEEHIAVPGDILFYTAHTPHEEWAESDETVVTWACGFRGGTFAPDEPVFRRDTYGKVQKILSQLTAFLVLDKFGGMRIPNNQAIPPIVQVLLAELERVKPQGPHALVDKVRAFVRSRIAQPISVEDLARHVGLSRCHFFKIYRDTTGRTPWKDIQLLRLEEAQRLIATTSMPLHEIAPRVGIASEYHLSRLIKSILGVGVRELRGA